MHYAYSKQKNLGEWKGGWMDGWMDGWVDGWKSGVKDCLQQSKIKSNFLLLK